MADMFDPKWCNNKMGLCTWALDRECYGSFTCNNLDAGTCKGTIEEYRALQQQEADIKAQQGK